MLALTNDAINPTGIERKVNTVVCVGMSEYHPVYLLKLCASTDFFKRGVCMMRYKQQV